MTLMTSMFQNMFPSINVTTVHLNSIRRCVLLNYDPKTGLVEFRHYTIKVVPVGMSRPVKKILQGKVPNLSRYDTMAGLAASTFLFLFSQYHVPDRPSQYLYELLALATP